MKKIAVMLFKLFWPLIKKRLPELLFKRREIHDPAKTLREVLEEDNEELRENSRLPDADIANKLRERADAKRKNKD